MESLLARLGLQDPDIRQVLAQDGEKEWWTNLRAFAEVAQAPAAHCPLSHLPFLGKRDQSPIISDSDSDSGSI